MSEIDDDECTHHCEGTRWKAPLPSDSVQGKIFLGSFLFCLFRR